MIEQVRFSQAVKFFEPGFIDKWKVSGYTNIYRPCLFVGVYHRDDIKTINKHKGFKVILNTCEIRPIFKQINPKNVVVRIDRDCFEEALEGKYKIKRARFPLKDFSMFQPNPLGDKVYCYFGTYRRRNFYGFELMEEIKKKSRFEVVYGFQGYDMEFVKREYYDKCFVNIKPSLTKGMMTAIELASMGRAIISNTEVPFCRKFSTNIDILQLIEEESKKIGTVQPSTLGNYFDTGEEWKRVEFWG